MEDGLAAENWASYLPPAICKGIVRLCTEKYVVPAAGNLDSIYSHLTNYGWLGKDDKRCKIHCSSERLRSIALTHCSTCTFSHQQAQPCLRL